MPVKRRKVLGDNYAYLFGNADDVKDTKETYNISLDRIRANPYQPRTNFDEAALKELSDSIKIHGIFTPVLLRETENGYELVAGERRFRAAQMAGLQEIPALIKNFTESEMMEISILENIQREDLDPIEEGAAYANLIKNLGYTQEMLAGRIGKSREYCANILRLQKLPEEVKQMISARTMTSGQARPLLGLKDSETAIKAAHEICERKMTARQSEQYVKKLLSSKVSKPERQQDKVQDTEEIQFAHELEAALGTEVTIRSNKIQISYKDRNDLNRLIKLIKQKGV